ncbi:MAG: hypothetical protein KAJ70_02735 [Candidatus Omnitrophica bacterium]|nr:hypothetical protein [Candidatus Omnitrophota bacterium]
MIRKHRKKRGQSMMEFVALIIFLMAAFIVFQKYIVRGFSGRWKSVGDALGQGRIFDPNLTTECAMNMFGPYGIPGQWYNQTCFEETCGERDCLRSTRTVPACTACITSCQTPICE